MGSGGSRLGRRPSRPRLHDRLRRSFSSLFICGGSTSRGSNEMEDNRSELLANSTKHGEPIVDELRSLTKESTLTSGARTELNSPRTEIGASSENSMIARENSSLEGGLIHVDTSSQAICLCEEVFPSSQFAVDYQGDDTASTSNEDLPFSNTVSANPRSNIDVVNGVDVFVEKDESQIGAEVTCPGSSSPQELGDSNSSKVSVVNNTSHPSHNSDSVVFDLPTTSHPHNDDTLEGTVPPGLGFHVPDREQSRGGGSVLQVDVVSISSSLLSSSSSEISNREARRNSRRLFWDAFSRRRSRRHSDSQTFVFSTHDSDGLGSRNRWLLDFSGDFSDNGVGGNSDSGYIGNRIQSMNEHRWHSRPEVWERLNGGHERGNTRAGTCPLGLHPHGTCSCESVLIAEESGTRASISRIVMLAEALFEVLDEIHRQPVSLSLSMFSRPAPEAVVDSFPVKTHIKPEATEDGDNVAQCYICLSEYEEEDKIRILPCCHEFHMFCVDKWLKEIHGVCPLCRGDVREGFTEEPVSNSAIPA